MQLFSVVLRQTRQPWELQAARLLIDGGVSEAGAWMPEQIVDAGQFLSRLAERGLKVELPTG